MASVDLVVLFFLFCLSLFPCSSPFGVVILSMFQELLNVLARINVVFFANSSNVSAKTKVFKCFVLPRTLVDHETYGV